MTRADDLARQRDALRERAADQRLAYVMAMATLRERLGALRTLASAAGILAGAGRALWRQWRRRAASRAEKAPGGEGPPADRSGS